MDNRPLEKLPPHSLEAEEAVLGSLLIDGEAVSKVITYLQPGDFYREKNQWVYEACVNLYRRGEAIDQVTVAHELERQEKLEALEGRGCLSGFIAETPTSVHVEHYAQIVHRMAVMRGLIRTGEQIKAIGYEAGPDMEKSLSRAMEAIMAVVQRSNVAAVVTPQRRAEMAMERYQRLAALQEGPAIPMGFPKLDELGGVAPGEVVVVGAYPKVGKTTVLMQMARAMCERGPVLFVSLEMSLAALDHREIARSIGVHTREVSQGHYEGRLMDMIMGQGVGELAELPIYPYTPARTTPVEIEAKGRRMQVEHGLVAVVVDYLQLMDAEGRSEYERVSNISRGLKAVAKALDVPLVVASQLHRPPGHNPLKPPGLMDLRGSGYIEADADKVLLLHRSDAFVTRQEWKRRFPEQDYPKGKATLMLVANRLGGEVIDIGLVWRGKSQVYEEVKDEAQST